MTAVLDDLRPVRGAGDRPALPVSLVSRPQRVLLIVIATVLLAGLLALVLGPARGLRNDIGLVQDLDASRDGIFGTLETGRASLGELREQLALTE